MKATMEDEDMKDEDVKEEESARNDPAFLQSILSSIAALLCNVINARGNTIVVMVKLMQRSEVSSKNQRIAASILDDILTRSRLCNTAEACFGWAYAWRLNVVCILSGAAPPYMLRRCECRWGRVRRWRPARRWQGPQ